MDYYFTLVLKCKSYLHFITFDMLPMVDHKLQHQKNDPISLE